MAQVAEGMIGMKAITLWQPWATFMAVGAKKIETRSWPTDYRGPIAIHASKNRDGRVDSFRDGGLMWDIAKRFNLRSLDDFPLGVVVATARLVQVSRMYQPMPGGTLPAIAVAPNGNVIMPSELEIDLGWWEPGRFAWVFDDVTRLDQPIPARGYQGLWDWEEQVA